MASDAAPREVRGFELAEVEAAAQRVRFVLLGKKDWFRATAIAVELGLERDTVRGHANVLVTLGLLRQRQVEGATRQAFEWCVTERGAVLRKRLGALLEGLEQAEATPTGVLVAAPGREDLLDELLHQTSAISAEARWILHDGGH